MTKEQQDEITTKLWYISEYIGGSNGVFSTWNRAAMKAIVTEQELFFAHSIWECCLSVPKQIAKDIQGVDFRQQDIDYIAGDEYKVFIAYLTNKPLPTRANGSSLDIGGIVNGTILSANTTIGTIYSLSTLLSSGSQDNTEYKAQLFAMLNKTISLFYDFIYTYKKYNPDFDTSKYLPDPKTLKSTTATNTGTNTTTPTDAEKESSFNKLMNQQFLQQQAIVQQKEDEKAAEQQKIQEQNIKEGVYLIAVIVAFFISIIAVKKVVQD